MKDKASIISEISDYLGSEGSWELAEEVYEELRSDDRIYYASDYEGLKIREDVDLIGVAGEILDRKNA